MSAGHPIRDDWMRAGPWPTIVRVTIWWAPGDPVLRWRGAVSVQHEPGWSAPWRVPYRQARLYLPEGGIGRAAMAAGVRLCLRTDSPELRIRYRAGAPPLLNGPQETAALDVRAGDGPARTLPLETGDAPAELLIDGLPGRMSTVELWLPPYSQFRLYGVGVADGAAVLRDTRERPGWTHYGSSISQGRGASSPAAAWPALVARAEGLDLTNVSTGAGAYLQPMFARLVRDLPADLVTCCAGINIQALGSLNADALVAAVVGWAGIVAEGHPDTPLVIMSTILAPDRESVPGPSGLTVAECRELIRRGVELVRAHGTRTVHYLDGLEVFGPGQAHLMLEPEGLDRLHPGPAGHPVFADRFRTTLRDLGVLPRTAQPVCGTTSTNSGLAVPPRAAEDRGPKILARPPGSR